jgi:hypothetical protein
MSYRVIADGQWFVVVKVDGEGDRRVLGRFLDQVEAHAVRSACERAAAPRSV